MTSLPVDQYEPGDLVFCYGTGFIARAIRFMQAIRSPKEDARWNHVAILDYKLDDGNWFVVQAEGHGVLDSRFLSEITPGGYFEVVKCPAAADPARVVDFARSQVGVKYGYMTIASIILNVITPKRFAMRKPGTWICSALAAGALWYAGWPPSEAWSDLYQVSPADLYGKI